MRWQYWLNMVAMHGLAWAMMAIACARTRTSWRNLSSSGQAPRWTRPFERWRKGSARSRLAWRLAMLDLNPMAWLEGRDRLQARVLGMFILAAAGFVMILHQASRQKWPTNDAAVLWPLFSHYLLCLWIAVEAPRRLADDKETGALELLLSTPIQPRQIVGGIMRTLRRRFGVALLALMALDGFVLWAYFDRHGSRGGFVWSNELTQMAAWALIVFPVQAYSLARVGLYQGLVQANSLRATFSVVWKLGLLPWVLFLVFVLACEIDRRNFRILPRLDDELAFGSWAFFHLFTCAAFLARANWQLRHRFRALAAAPPRAFWKR